MVSLFGKKISFQLKKPWSINRKGQIIGLGTMFLCLKVVTIAQFFLNFHFIETLKQLKWSNYLTFAVVDHRCFDENVIFSKKRDHGLKSEYSLDRLWSYFRDFTVIEIFCINKIFDKN
jgi:hypothetical protein